MRKQFALRRTGNPSFRNLSPNLVSIETRKPLDRAAAELCGCPNQSSEAVS
jgi:hypothetical protein